MTYTGRKFEAHVTGSSPRHLESQAMVLAEKFFGKDARLVTSRDYAVTQCGEAFQAVITIFELESP